MPIVIIPAYKPDKTLTTLADQLWTYGCHMIVIDDGSGKEYGQIFDRVRDVCIVLEHSENRGKGAAIKTALSYIRNEILQGDTMKQEEIWDSGPIGVMDCDGQHLPEDMLKLLEAARTHRRTLVLGVRNVGREMPLKSRLGNLITRAVFRFVSGVKVSDTQTGLRAFGPELIPELLSVEGERYEYEMNVLMVCAKTKIPLKEVPISTIYRDKSNSTSHFRGLKDSVRIYKDILKFALSSFSSFVLACFLFIMNNLFLEMFVQIFRMSVYPAKLLTECLLFVLSWTVQKGMYDRKNIGLV